MTTKVAPVYNINYTYWDQTKYHTIGQAPDKVPQLITTSLNDNITFDSRNSEASYILYDRQGNIVMKAWHRLGFMHRLEGPALIRYGLSGLVISQEWYYNSMLLTSMIDDGMVRIETSGAIAIDSLFTLEMME